MARGAQTPGLRPFLPADAATLAALFRASVEALAADDYDDAQREAWASAADDEAAFASRLADALTIVALVDGDIAGFASLRDNKMFDMLYVRPDMARKASGRRCRGDRETRRRARNDAADGRGLRRGAGLFRGARLCGHDAQYDRRSPANGSAIRR